MVLKWWIRHFGMEDGMKSKTKKSMRIRALFLVLVLVLSGFLPHLRTNNSILQVEAADVPGVQNEYVIMVGENYYKHRSEIMLDRDMTIQLMYVDENGMVQPIVIPDGQTIKIEWNVVDDESVSNDTVFTAVGESKNPSLPQFLNYCKMTIKGVGYCNLTARVSYIDTATNETKNIIDYSWKFHVQLAIDSANINVLQGKTENNNQGEYGLRYAFATDKMMTTLQISGPEVLSDADSNNDKFNKYLLLLKKANLLYSDYNYTDPITGVLQTIKYNNFSTEADIEKSPTLRNLLEEKVIWTTSDSDVVTVKYGVITGVGAGTAIVTATTASSDGVSEQSVSITVVVKPTGYVVIPSVPVPEYKGEFTEKLIDASNFTINTNAKDATKLVWTVHKKDANGDILWASNLTRKTDQFTVDVYDSSGSVYFSKVKAGTYYITARVSEDYAENNENVAMMKATITVPVSIPGGPLYMNVSDTYNIIENSSINIANWYTYEPENSTIADVSAKGVITAISEGDTRIKLTRNAGASWDEYLTEADVPQEKYITVHVIDAIHLNYSSATIYTNATLNLKAYTTNKTLVNWTSSDESIATVDETGLVTGKKEGSAVITATQFVKGIQKTATCQLTVRENVSEITLSPSEKDIAVGDNLTINADIKPSLNGVTLKWVSSDPEVVAIATTGDLSATVTAVAGGTAVISAINQDNVVVGSCLLHVFEPITGITLSQTNVVLPLSTGWFQLFATITPSTAANQEVIWTSTDPKVATVDSNGVVTLVLNGKTSIIATSKTDAGISAICNLEVTKSVGGIKLDKTTHDMFVGETFRLTYTITPVGASNATVLWTSSNSAVATVAANGMVTAKGVGTTVILAKTQDGGFTATCTVNVGRVATAVKLDVTKLALNAGDYYYLDAILTPADTTETTVTYDTSDKAVAIVSKKGKVTAKKAGTCVIMAKTKSGSMAYCAVTVMQGVTGIEISDKELEIPVGESYEFSAEVIPDTASNLNIKWTSSNPEIVKIDEHGEIDALMGGVAIITCTTEEGGFMDFCVVTVIEEVSDLELNYNFFKLGLNATERLIATISGETATNKDVIWSSSDDSIVSVDNNGRIKGLKMGTATINCVAADGSEAEDNCEVRVCTLVTNIELDVSYLTLIQGHSYSLKSRVYPSNATYNEAVFKSDNNEIAIVDSKGVITALSPGSTIIHAEANDSSGVSAICYVNVIAPIPATNVSISESEVIMSPGETKTVAISLVPNNTTESVTWTSDNTVVATVDKDSGLITAGEIGTANITIMTESGRKGSVKVFVVGLSRSSVTLQQYTSTLLKLEVDGSGSNNIKIRWDVDNQEIANVTNGRITAKALGTTTVYAVVNGRRLACVVKVVKIK